MTAPTLKAEHAACRTFAHWWKPFDAERKGSVFIADLRCQRCHSHRIDTIDRQGNVTHRRYRLATGYLLKGGLTREQKSGLRLTVLGVE